MATTMEALSERPPSTATQFGSETVWQAARRTGTAYSIMGAVQLVLTFIILTNLEAIPNAADVPPGLLFLGMIVGAVWGFAGVLLIVRSRPAVWTGLCVGGLINILYVGLQVINFFGASTGQGTMPLFWTWIGILMLKSAGKLCNALTSSSIKAA